MMLASTAARHPEMHARSMTQIAAGCEYGCVTMDVVVFRADASRTIGGGHVFRCLTLADALAENGWRCIFAVSAETTATLPRLCQAGHDVYVLPAGHEADPAILRSAVDECNLLVLDHYQLGAPYEASCRRWACKILAI